jgi:predicted AAA+ superfamily ATPase
LGVLPKKSSLKKVHYNATFSRMYERHLLAALRDDLDQFPAVALLGPRQTGKTTLALALGRTQPSLYLDLESPAALASWRTLRHFCCDRRIAW